MKHIMEVDKKRHIPSSTNFAPIPAGNPTNLDMAEYFESP
jgi:hypothetical protein